MHLQYSRRPEVDPLSDNIFLAQKRGKPSGRHEQSSTGTRSELHLNWSQACTQVSVHIFMIKDDDMSL